MYTYGLFYLQSFDPHNHLVQLSPLKCCYMCNGYTSICSVISIDHMYVSGHDVN